MRINNRILYGILSIALAALIAFIAIPVVNSRTNGVTEIVRFTQPVMRGEIITDQSFEITEVGSYNLPSGIARTESDVSGLYATTDFESGDYILLSKLSAAPISSDLQLNSIPSGKVAISLTVKSLASGLSDKLQSGDIIRIYHYLDYVREIPELQFVKVLSVTDSKGLDVDNSQEVLPDETKRQSATITVLASPEQAILITSIENDGVAHVAMISRGDDRLATELLKMQETVLEQILAELNTEGDEELDPESQQD